MALIVRRCRWYDKANNRYFSDTCHLKVEGTRYSKEFAAFFKECMETIPTTSRSLDRYYHINGDTFEKRYKEILCGYREWSESSHAEEWLVFPGNMATNAFAESFNAKIKAFRASLRGVTDIRFFLFRLTKLYA